MKKKITAVALIVALFALLVVGGTFAYFKDTESAMNVMTVGDLDILLHEDNGLDSSDKALLKDDAYREWLTAQPFVPTVTLEKDAYIENTGSNDAYVRMFVVYPKTIAPMLNIAWDADISANWDSSDVAYTVYGVEYVGKCLVYKANDGVLAPNKSTTDTITSVTLLQDVECVTVKGVTTYTLVDAADSSVVYTHVSTTGQFPVLVYAQAGQVVNGLNQWNNAAEALNIMFGTPDVTNPWAAEMNAEFNQAIENGEVIVDGITLTEITDTATSVTIDGAMIKNVGDWAGFEATKLEEIVFTEGVESLGYRTFKSNATLKKVVIPGTVTDIGSGSFQECSALESVTLSEGITAISDQAFYSSSLPAIVLPESLERIENKAFEATKISTVTIPENVDYIANYAFRDCINLKTVYILSDNVTFGGTSMAFSNYQSGDAKNITIYVKNDSVKAALEVAQGSAYGYTVVVDSTLGA